MRVREGDRVVVRADPEEGWGRETAVVLGVDAEVITIQVDAMYRDGPKDDGLREVVAEQLEG